MAAERLETPRVAWAVEVKDTPVVAKGIRIWSNSNYEFWDVPREIDGGTLLRMPMVIRGAGNDSTGQLPPLTLKTSGIVFVIFVAKSSHYDRSGGLASSLPRHGWKPIYSSTRLSIRNPLKGGNASFTGLGIYHISVWPKGEIRFPALTTPECCLAVVVRYAKHPKRPLKLYGDEKESKSSTAVVPISETPKPEQSPAEQNSENKQMKAKDVAEEEAKAMLKKHFAAPRHILDGAISGVKLAGSGVLLGIGSLCYAPYAGARDGGIGGFAKGLAQGVGLAVAAPALGVIGGVTQIVRGAIQTPGAIKSGLEGKVWDADLEKYVRPVPYDLTKHYYAVKRKLESKGIDASSRKKQRSVKHTKLYDLLNVSPDATSSQIRKAYYKEALKCHPDKNIGDEKANERFQQLSKAYQVLSNPRLRDQYDKHGEKAADGVHVDVVLATAVFFSTLFGSEEFEPFLGQLEIATTFGDILQQMDEKDSNPAPTTESDREKAEDRQVLCAIHMMKLIEPYVCGNKEAFIAHMREVVISLAAAPFGGKIIKNMGQVYKTAAKMYLGGVKGSMASLTKGFSSMKTKFNLATEGFRAYRAASRIATTANSDALTLKNVESKVIKVDGPEVTRVLKLESEKFGYVELQLDCRVVKITVSRALSQTEPKENENYGFLGDRIWVDNGCRAIFNVTVTRKPLEKKDEKKSEEADQFTTVGRQRASQREIEKSLPVFLNAMWAFTELDIHKTLHGVSKKLLTDIGVDKGTRRARAKALLTFAEILLATRVEGEKRNASLGSFSAEDAKDHFMKAMQTAMQKATEATAETQ